jgi:hypothetical protein
MNGNDKGCATARLEAIESHKDKARQLFEIVLGYCERSDQSFAKFEVKLFPLMAVLGRQLIQLFFVSRDQRLNLEPYLDDGKHRLGKTDAERTLKTAYGTVTYARTHLIRKGKGPGFHPLDMVLGLTRDRLSPWVMQWVAQLATRMSFSASRMAFKAVLNWAPATETIEQVVLGIGRDAAPFMQQLPAPAPPKTGDVLVIEIDGKCPPTATEAELTKRRGKRKPKHEQDCACGCQRHRGKAKRQARGCKKRRKKGDKSKNGKEVVVVVMYLLRLGSDGRLHGPNDKKLYATFAGRKAAALWARAEATKRGFGPETTQTVQIVLDGAKGLKHSLEPLFPRAIFTLDVCHVVEKLWALGRHFHAEGSEELKVGVEELKTLVYAGKAKELVKRFIQMLRQVSMHGPGTKGRRKALISLIGYVRPRRKMMRYAEWLEKDLVIATGQVEGAVRHLVGERFDCGGMRWVQGKAEALLHLRCIELNGDWQKFRDWFQNQIQARLRKERRIKILTDRPIQLPKKSTKAKAA